VIEIILIGLYLTTASPDKPARRQLYGADMSGGARRPLGPLICTGGR
jgi:hypothetical protein